MSQDLLDSPVWWDDDGNILTEGADGQPAYVMVQFEKPMMEKVAEIICQSGGHILNIGYGCGLVDDAIEQHEIASHTIVEPHPQVIARMAELGWTERPHVTIHQSRWQDVDWSQYRGHFDGVFWDPFPFEEGEPRRLLDFVAWNRLVTGIVKPKTGVFVCYNVTSDPDAAARLAPSFPGAELEFAAEPCDVDVPFEIPEWRSVGTGRQRIYIPHFRVTSRS